MNDTNEGGKELGIEHLESSIERMAEGKIHGFTVSLEIPDHLDDEAVAVLVQGGMETIAAYYTALCGRYLGFTVTEIP